MTTNSSHITKEALPQPTILVSECPRGTWLQYQVISDERCVIIEMVPALFSGWKFHRVIVQGAVDWSGRSAAAIVAGYNRYTGQEIYWIVPGFVYSLGRTLWPDGTRAPHGRRNGQPDSDGGYALKHSWL